MQGTYTLGDCTQPVAVEYDAAAGQVLIACRGDKPVFIAPDPSNGRIVATIPIGRGVDGPVRDGQGLIIIRQDGPDRYSLVETILTRP